MNTDFTHAAASRVRRGRNALGLGLTAAVLSGAAVLPGAAVAAAKPSDVPYSSVTVNQHVVRSGQQVTISGNGPKNSRAGSWITLQSDAIVSKTSVNGIPSIRTQELVNGKYSITATIRSGLKPTTYAIAGSFNGRPLDTVAWVKVGAKSQSRDDIALNRCAASGFAVLHNDRAGTAYLPAGSYTVSSTNMDCRTASAAFTSLLAGAGKPISGWASSSTPAGRATFTQRSSGLSFSVAKSR